LKQRKSEANIGPADEGELNAKDVREDNKDFASSFGSFKNRIVAMRPLDEEEEEEEDEELGLIGCARQSLADFLIE